MTHRNFWIIMIFMMLLYFGIGSLLHAYMVGPMFNWSSAWTWGWLLGWPVALILAYWIVLIALLVVSIAASVLIVILETEWFQRWSNNRTLRRAADRRGR